MTTDSDDTRDAEVDDASTDTEGGTVPAAVADEAERLTRLAREAVDDNEAAARRERCDDLLAEYGFTARIRDDDGDAVLVLHPEEWLVDGVVDIERVDDTDRAVERRLSGTGDGEDWERVAAHNRRVAERVEREHGRPHGENADALATFASNHYAKPIGKLTPAEREEFLSEYFPRNAWPTAEQSAAVEESVDIVLDVARDAENVERRE